MIELVKHIAGQVDKIADVQIQHGERLTNIETRQSMRVTWRTFVVAIAGLLLTAAALFIRGS